VNHAHHPITMPGRRAFLAWGLTAIVAGCAQAPDRLRLPYWREIVARGDLIQSGPEYERIKRIGQLVLRPLENGPAWQFGIDPSLSPISLAAIGNGLVVSKGALQLCENDGQVAAILALRAETLRLTNQRRSSNSAKADPDALDAIVIRQLARAGYDPRDALVIAQRLVVGAQDGEAQVQSLRITTMNAELRKMGYQV
jgi:hypothetical protein